MIFDVPENGVGGVAGTDGVARVAFAATTVGVDGTAHPLPPPPPPLLAGGGGGGGGGVALRTLAFLQSVFVRKSLAPQVLLFSQLKLIAPESVDVAYP